MKEFKKEAAMTVREYLNTLSSEEFANVIIGAVMHLDYLYIETELDALDVSFSIKSDMTDWLDDLYDEDKALLPSSSIIIDEDEI